MTDRKRRQGSDLSAHLRRSRIHYGEGHFEVAAEESKKNGNQYFEEILKKGRGMQEKGLRLSN